ncbi:A-kinase anchor protein 11 isoform X3 [Varanus komodoensis]|uniref:A-kinase anchor protein 11 isoform X3 n=1 Tax=Varanus komodoensis TaxID=61221 RepID=UPI001CF7932E|nr:A-kinase anchor protein 11 isoform X3 [Varanus komodoensis]
MDGPIGVRSSQRKSKISRKKNFTDCALPPMKALLQSQKELCSVSAEEPKEENGNFHEVTFLCLADETTLAAKELAAMSSELPDLLKSLHLCSLHENEVIFLKDINRPLGNSDVVKEKNYASRVLCVMRLSPSCPRPEADSVFTLLSKYAAGIRCTLEMHSLQKHLSDVKHTEDDDTNQSVSSIEDDFVTALEHFDEDEPTRMTNPGPVIPEKHENTTSHISHLLESVDPKNIVNSQHLKVSVGSSAALVNILEFKELSSSARNSVTTSISDPWAQRSFFRLHNSSDHSANLLHKTLFSSSPVESSESDCSSPSPVIFLDEEGYQKSLKAKLQLPKIPVMKDGIEDLDSEVSEFFDSFDQFDEQDPSLENSAKHTWDPILGSPSQKEMIPCNQLCSTTTAMNPPKLKFDRPALPAHVRKPTPRKPESPYSNLLDVPGSPRPVKTSGEDSGCLFSPIRSSAFSPLGSCFSAECFCQAGVNRDAINQNHRLACHTYSDFANNVSFEILGSVFNSRSLLCPCKQEVSNNSRIFTKDGKGQAAKNKGEISGKGVGRKGKSKCRSLMIKDHIQKFASELVEKSLGSAFKDLRKGVSSCTNTLCHLAAKLTSSVFQMAFYEIGRQQALSLKKKAVNGLAGFLVSEAITGALKELHSVKQQIFTNTVAKFAANLVEELIFEGIMEVCQFSHPSTPTASQNWSFHYNDKVVHSYAKDLSDSVIQEAFIELSQVDVMFTTQAAISISMDNIKYINAERILESAQTTSVSSEFPDKMPVTLNPVQEFRKEYTVHKALFYTSGIASSVPLPLAGSVLRSNQILSDDAKIRNLSESDGGLKIYKDSAELCYATKKQQSEVTSVRNVYLTTDTRTDHEYNTQSLCVQSDFKQASNSDISKFSDSPAGMPSINNFSGTMVDMIVTEAYETVTFSKASKSSEQYTDMLKMEKRPYLQCIGEDTCKNMFTNYLAKRIVKQSVDETKSACSATGEKLAYCVGLGTDTKGNRKELHSAIKQFEQSKSVPVIVGQRQMPVSSASKFHVTPVYSNRCLPSASNDCLQDKKKYITCRVATCMSPPCSTAAFAKPAEDCSDPESSARSLNDPLEKHNLHKAVECSVVCPEKALDMNSCTSASTNCEEPLQMEDRSSIREGHLSAVPDTPPPTPLVPSQSSSEWTLRKLTKKLKGELAKEFAPATPPSTPYRSEIDGVCENQSHDLEKEEFMLKLMWSLSEEVENSDDEEYSETLTERVKTSARAIEYADNLATGIISMATEMAASYLDGKGIQMRNSTHLPVNGENQRYTAFMNVPESTLLALRAYAGDMAGKVISEAKKVMKARHCKLLRQKQCSYQADGFHLKKNYQECCSKDRKYSLARHWSRETDAFILPLPHNSEAPGLTSKYPSCESVTDEYADHIIRILKKEGGHLDLIMDQFASRLACRAVKYGTQQAARKLKMKHNRKIVPVQNSYNKLELFERVNKDVDINRQRKSNFRQFGRQACSNQCCIHRNEHTKLLDFSGSVASSITSDVTRKLMSAPCLPKSLTDSCLYEKSKTDKVTDLKAASKTLSPFHCKQKLYHSTGSLNDSPQREGILHAIEHYARKVVDDTLEVSLESVTHQNTKNQTNGDRSTHAEKLSPFSATACRHCNMKEEQYCTGISSLLLTGPDVRSKAWEFPNAGVSADCPQSHVLHLDIPKIHIDMDEKAVFADNIVAVAFDKAGRQLSNTSLTADSGIGQDGVSFAESLTTEIMTSCMTNIATAVNLSSTGKEGFNSADSMASQQMSLSPGDDSTGSWSNLSFEDEHPDESSSFLHLSDSDGTEEKDEELKETTEAGSARGVGKALTVANVDIGPCVVDSQLRMTLQWLTASEAEVSELHFRDSAPKDFVPLSKQMRERGWKVGDLFQAVLKYHEVMEKAPDGERPLENRTFFRWLQERV